APGTEGRGPRRGGLRLLRADDGRAGGLRGRARGRARAAQPPGRQRLERARAVDRHRGAHLRLAHLPHQQRARLGLRHPLRRLQRLPAPRLDGARRSRLPDADRAGHDDAVLRAPPQPRAGARAGRGAGRRARRGDARQPRGEGDQPDRAAALRGVHPWLHRQAVADRPAGAAGADHHPAAGALHVRHPLLHRHPRGHPCRGVRRAADADGPHAGGHRAHRCRLVRRRRRPPGRHPRRLHRPGRPVLRLPRRSPELAHPRPGDRGARGRRPPGHHGHELRRRGRRAHPGARVPALPPRAPERRRADRRHDRVLAVGAAGRRAVLPRRHARGPAPAAGLPRAHGPRGRRALRRAARQLPVPRHAHGDRLRADGVRHRGPPGPAAREGRGL
ncbi:MAG: UDP-galactopyranose mutase, partial [uncultured Frankineae bacterium]